MTQKQSDNKVEQSSFTLIVCFDSKLVVVVVVIGLRVTSHLIMRLTAMRVTVIEISSHLCNILILIIVKAYL